MDRLFRAVAVLVIVAAHSACTGRAAAPLAHTFASPEALAAAVAEGLERRDTDGLLSLALSEEEFRAHVWPHLPASRAERGVPFGLVWGQLYAKSRAYLQQTLVEFGGRRPEIVEVRFRGDVSNYGRIQVRRDAEVVVRDEGRRRTVRLFGSVVARDGRYKLFSYVAD